MSVEMIEAAWTDPVLRRELTEKGEDQIPDHPVGTLTGFAGTMSADESISMGCIGGYSSTPVCSYYIQSAGNCIITDINSGDHCCY